MAQALLSTSSTFQLLNRMLTLLRFLKSNASVCLLISSERNTKCVLISSSIQLSKSWLCDSLIETFLQTIYSWIDIAVSIGQVLCLIRRFFFWFCFPGRSKEPIKLFPTSFRGHGCNLSFSISSLRRGVRFIASSAAGKNVGAAEISEAEKAPRYYSWPHKKVEILFFVVA